jgi:chromosome segregation ATPase
MTSTVILVLIGIAVVLFFAWPQFRQMLRIRGNDAVSKGTTAIERNKDRYRELKGKLPGQREAVANCMATVDDITSDLRDAEEELAGIQGEYKTAKEMQASEAALDALGKKFEAGEAKIARIKGRLKEAQGVSAEAQTALSDTVEALQGFAEKIEDSELSASLTAALETSAAAKQQAKDISDKLSEAAEDFDAVEHDLNVARNKNKLADGSETDRELKDIKTKAAAKTGRGKLDALTGGGTTTPPADKPQS